jgi:hypothetical protein
MIDTYSTFVAGYVAATAVYVVYVVSLALRAKRAKERLREKADPSLRSG